MQVIDALGQVDEQGRPHGDQHVGAKAGGALAVLALQATRLPSTKASSRLARVSSRARKSSCCHILMKGLLLDADQPAPPGCVRDGGKVDIVVNARARPAS